MIENAIVSWLSSMNRLCFWPQSQSLIGWPDLRAGGIDPEHDIPAAFPASQLQTFTSPLALLNFCRSFLLISHLRMTMPEAVKALSDPVDFALELQAAGYTDPQIDSVTFDYALDIAALIEPDTLFGMSPDWTSLSDAERAAVVA